MLERLWNRVLEIGERMTAKLPNGEPAVAEKVRYANARLTLEFSANMLGAGHARGAAERMLPRILGMAPYLTACIAPHRAAVSRCFDARMAGDSDGWVALLGCLALAAESIPRAQKAEKRAAFAAVRCLPMCSSQISVPPLSINRTPPWLPSTCGPIPWFEVQLTE